LDYGVKTTAYTFADTLQTNITVSDDQTTHYSQKVETGNSVSTQQVKSSNLTTQRVKTNSTLTTQMGGLHPKTDILYIISINPAVLTFSSDKVLTFPLRLTVVIEFSICSVDVVSGVDASLPVLTTEKTTAYTFADTLQTNITVSDDQTTHYTQKVETGNSVSTQQVKTSNLNANPAPLVAPVVFRKLQAR
jgi:hypothetical protein